MSLLGGWGAATAQAEEFSPFRITEVEGALTIKRSDDRTETASIGAAEAQVLNTQSDRSSAVVASVLARGFIYHPNLIGLEAGFGAIQQRSRLTTGPAGAFGDTRASESLYDLSARVTVLRDKPYNGSVFYEHLNPSVTLGPALVIVQETTRQGLQLAIQDPITPVPLGFEAERLRSSGKGSGRIVQDKADRYSLTADRSHGRLGSTRLRVDDSRLDSQSGSTDLPIVRTSSRTLTAGLDSRLRFGTDDRVALTSLVTYNALAYGLGINPPADRHEVRGLVDVRTRHSMTLQSFATFDVMRADQGEQRNRSRNAAGGATWTPAVDLVSTLEARSEALHATDYAYTSRSVLGSASRQWGLAGGKAQAAYAVRYDDRSQRVTSPTTPLTGERHVLTGTTPVSLDRARVVAGSVLVANEARTQIYVEGRDFVVAVLGVQSRLQRIVGGDIIDGQLVLVDYAVETGGSFDSSQRDQSLSLFWSWGSLLNLSARWIESAPRVTGGVPLLTLNTVHSQILRAQAEVPVAGLGLVGGSAEREDRRETLLPYRRTGGELFVQWDEAFFGQGGVRIGLRRQRVTYDDSPQDVDLSGYDIRYRVFTAQGIDVQVDWTSETDTGNTVKRRRDFGSLRARWRFRQLLMTLSVTRAKELQDSLQTTRTIAQWLLRREF